MDFVVQMWRFMHARRKLWLCYSFPPTTLLSQAHPGSLP